MMSKVHKATQFRNGICLPPMNYQNQYDSGQIRTIVICTGMVFVAFRELQVLKQNQIILSITFTLE